MNKKKGGKVAAVIDIGSNLLKMRICQLRKGEITNLDRLQYPLSLGHEVFTAGKISFESLRELSGILQGYSEIMAEYETDQYAVVATTALREAKNRAYVLDQLKIQNDMTVDVLEDDQEKTLIYSEILSCLENMAPQETQKIGNALISYIGAGTIGLAVFDGKNMVFSQNVPMGALKLHDMLGSIQEETDSFYSVVEEYLDSIIGRIRLPQPKNGFENLVLTGNEIELIAKICGIEPENGRYIIEAKQIKNLYTEVRSLSKEKISDRFNIEEEVAELLYSALAIYVRLMQFVKSEYIIAPKVDLWFALMKQMLIPKSAGEYAEHVRVNALSCAKAMARIYHVNENHTENIRKFACKIFDKMKGTHGLDKRKRLLLELAAIMHDCGHYVNAKEHLSSSFDLLKNIDLYGMTAEEMRIIAYIARYNEYDVPNYDEFEFVFLGDETRLVISKLVAIFRLANALDKSHKQKFNDIKARLEKERLLITAETNANIYLEKWAFDQTAPFFKEVFGINPELSIKSTII